jgi:2-methylcitrate dehydratase PrpD
MHGVWGTVGAAAAVARYRGFDAETTAHALRIAANHALHTHIDAAIEGATVRNTYAGMSNTNGILAADQAAAGFTGLEDGLRRHLDRLCEEEFDESVATADLGTRWEVTRGYFKHHAACRYTHGALDAVAAIADRATVDPDAVDSVLVETYPVAARLDRTDVSNPLQAKFSVPFAVATALRTGTTDKAAFEPAAITPATTDLARRVRVTSTPEFAARVPDARSTRVTVTLTDGSELTEEVRHAKGDHRNPLTGAELEAKFRSLVEPTLGVDRTANLWAALGDLPETTASDLCRLATPSGL